MAALLEPDPDDVLIRRHASGDFTVGLCSGAAQIESHDFEGALHVAGRFAAREGVNLWYEDARGAWHNLADIFTFRRFWNGFIEFPALRLTRPQARCLLAVDVDVAASVLDSLVELGFLIQTADDGYARSADRHRALGQLRMKKAAPRRHAITRTG